MFNNNQCYNFVNSVNIKPACSGILQKSHPNSFFRMFHKNSKMADWIFDEEPCLKRGDRQGGYDKYMDVIVLQVMCYGDNEFLCELLDAEELNEEE